MEDSNPLAAIVVTIILVAINGVLASTEIAIVGLNETKLSQYEKNGDKKTKILLQMKRNPSDFLSTIQIGITLAGLLSGAFAADSLAKPIVEWAASLGAAGTMLSVINVASVVLITLLITFFMLVFGELVPKRAAMSSPEKTARRFIMPVYYLSKITKPLVWLLSVSTNGVLRLFGVSNNEEQERITEEEILLMIREGRRQGTIEENEMEIVTNLFDFTDSRVEEAMTHRTEIHALPVNASIKDVVEVMSKTFHSRFPVFENDIDNVVGILYTQDIVALYPIQPDEGEKSIRQIMREPFFVPENGSLSVLFSQMKQKKNTMAIVVDEFGGTAGIITMLDIVEEIVGDVEPNDYDQIKEKDDGTWLVDGRIEMEDIIKYFKLEDIEDPDMTLSGYLVETLGYLPSEKQKPQVTIGGYIFQVKKMAHTRILLVSVRKAE